MQSQSTPSKYQNFKRSSAAVVCLWPCITVQWKSHFQTALVSEQHSYGVLPTEHVYVGWQRCTKTLNNSEALYIVVMGGAFNFLPRD